jgi:hypothetical protein
MMSIFKSRMHTVAFRLAGFSIERKESMRTQRARLG